MKLGVLALKTLYLERLSKEEQVEFLRDLFETGPMDRVGPTINVGIKRLEALVKELEVKLRVAFGSRVGSEFTHLSFAPGEENGSYLFIVCPSTDSHECPRITPYVDKLVYRRYEKEVSFSWSEIDALVTYVQTDIEKYDVEVERRFIDYYRRHYPELEGDIVVPPQFTSVISSISAVWKSYVITLTITLAEETLLRETNTFKCSIHNCARLRSHLSSTEADFHTWLANLNLHCFIY